MGRKKTHEEFVKEVNETHNNAIVVLSKYVNARTPVMVRCIKCNYEWKTRSKNLTGKYATGCPNCWEKRLRNLHKEKNIKAKNEFNEKLKKIHNGKITPLEDYKDSRTKILVKCENGHIFKAQPNSLLSGHGCIQCFNEQQTKDHNEFVNEVDKKYKGKIKVIGKYKNANEKVKVKCSCGYVWNVSPTVLLKRKTSEGCPKCIRNKQRIKHQEKFDRELEKVHKGNIKIIGQYVNSQTKVRFKCNYGHEFEMLPTNILKGQGCKYCYDINRRKTTKQFKKEVYELVNNEYLVVSEYISSNEKIKFYHKKCNKIFKMTPNSFLVGNRCPFCRSNAKKDTEWFKEKVDNLTNGEFTVLGEYENSATKILMKHNKCGYEWSTTPNNFLRYLSCPSCMNGLSKANLTIQTILKNSFGINTYKEKRFDDCRDKYPLPFDICINNKLLIEADGEQHFQQIDFAGKGDEWAKEKLKDTQRHDKIKNQYCIDNNIPLIRIPYWEYDNIEYILKNVLMHFDLIQKDNTYDESIVKKYLVDENWDHDKYIEMSKNY